jgi:hypothetical protein
VLSAIIEKTLIPERTVGFPNMLVEMASMETYTEGAELPSKSGNGKSIEKASKLKWR